MNIAFQKYTADETLEFEDTDQAVDILKGLLGVFDAMFNQFDTRDYFQGSPLKQLECLNRAVVLNGRGSLGRIIL